MISDVLWEAREEIRSYMSDPVFSYSSDPVFRAEIEGLLEHMARIERKLAMGLVAVVSGGEEGA